MLQGLKLFLFASFLVEGLQLGLVAFHVFQVTDRRPLMLSYEVFVFDRKRCEVVFLGKDEIVCGYEVTAPTMY